MNPDHPHALSKRFRGVYFGKSPADPYLEGLLADVDFATATRQLHGCNSIYTLTFHLHYYVRGLIDVLRGGPLAIRDKYSFDHPPLVSEEAWTAYKTTVLEEGRTFAKLIENLTEAQIWDAFVQPQYGDYYQNLHGIIEHCYYHLGQIGLLKRLLKA